MREADDPVSEPLHVVMDRDVCLRFSFEEAALEAVERDQESPDLSASLVDGGLERQPLEVHQGDYEVSLVVLRLLNVVRCQVLELSELPLTVG